MTYTIIINVLCTTQSQIATIVQHYCNNNMANKRPFLREQPLDKRHAKAGHRKYTITHENNLKKPSNCDKLISSRQIKTCHKTVTKDMIVIATPSAPRYTKVTHEEDILHTYSHIEPDTNTQGHTATAIGRKEHVYEDVTDIVQQMSSLSCSSQGNKTYPPEQYTASNPNDHNYIEISEINPVVSAIPDKQQRKPPIPPKSPWLMKAKNPPVQKQKPKPNSKPMMAATGNNKKPQILTKPSGLQLRNRTVTARTEQHHKPVTRSPMTTTICETTSNKMSSPSVTIPPLVTRGSRKRRPPPSPPVTVQDKTTDYMKLEKNDQQPQYAARAVTTKPKPKPRRLPPKPPATDIKAISTLPRTNTTHRKVHKNHSVPALQAAIRSSSTTEYTQLHSLDKPPIYMTINGPHCVMQQSSDYMYMDIRDLDPPSIYQSLQLNAPTTTPDDSITDKTVSRQTTSCINLR